jgi:hypothetical protein
VFSPQAYPPHPVSQISSEITLLFVNEVSKIWAAITSKAIFTDTQDERSEAPEKGQQDSAKQIPHNKQQYPVDDQRFPTFIFLIQGIRRCALG